VINSSPGDLTPVFDAVLDKAIHLCGAAFGTLWTYDGEHFDPVALRRVPPAFAAFLSQKPFPTEPGSTHERLIRGERFVQVEDIAAEALIGPARRALVEDSGTRTLINVPLRKDDRLLGSITAFRQEVRPFSEQQIALLENFAAQAVIAMGNARLLDELRTRTRDLEESLEYQTAISDVLKVISRSVFDLEAVLQTVVKTAMRLCRADSATIYRNEGGEYRWAAGHMLSPEYEKLERAVRIRPGAGTVVGRAAMERTTVHIEDAWTDPLYEAREDARVGGVRTMIGVPLLREGAAIGVIGLARRRIEAFSEREIQLVATFADQAAIAIENARLIAELRRRTNDLQESLEYQTATSDVLKVISRSTFDLDPVLEYVIETAIRLCRASMGSIFRLEGDVYRWAVGRGLSPEYREVEQRNPIAPGSGTLVGRVAVERRSLQIADALTDPLYTVKDEARLTAARTMLGVPLLREGMPIGVIAMARDRVEPFSDSESELVTTFADQAVIAIENARLLTETREALKQQTATAEVLQVINSSPGNLTPVFQALLDKALALCGAAFGVLWTYDGEHLHATALHGVPAAFAEFLTRAPHPVGSQNAHGRLLSGEPVVHVVDLQADEAHRDRDPIRRSLVELGGGRVLLAVPLCKDDALLGVFTIYRQEPHPFSEKQIALLQSFAAQAVIAMDNARLLDEIRQRQAELRVTFDNMGDGVAMFDADLKLAAWNRNFQQILELPDEFVASRPSFPEYFGYLAKRGEYPSTDLEAEFGGRLDETERELRFERTRPDGRVIEVRRNPVPGGGFVLIYADITERKRAEAEIAAARDAAERALGELKTAQASLVQAEKMASLGQLTAGIAHEIKNPLNFVNNFASLSVELLDELKEAAAPALAVLDEERRAQAEDIVATLTGNLTKIAEHGQRADGIVRSMLAHSRGGRGERQSVDLNALVDEALSLAYHGARAQDQSFNIVLERDFDHFIAPIELIPQDVTRVLLNLFGNGFYATSKRRNEAKDGEFEPRLKVTTCDLGAAVEIKVRDNGAGIAPELRDKLFQPFFTTKPTGEGTGLGLSISWDIVTQQHGGTIAADSRPGEYTEFTIRLPRRAAIRAGQPLPQPSSNRLAPRLL
ncbi:MAG: GAF domain-containing protein, partial [Stellaceae bacterium]